MKAQKRLIERENVLNTSFDFFSCEAIARFPRRFALSRNLTPVNGRKF